VREYVYAEMTALQRAALHLTAARHLHTESDANAATLARHYDRGEDRANTYRFALRAAREGKGTGGQKEAAAMADLAMRSAANLDEKLVALHLLAEAELESAQLAHAKEHFKEILRLDEAMPPERRVEVKLKLVESLAELSEWSQAKSMIKEASPEVESIPDLNARLQGRAESLFWTLKIATRENDTDTAREVARVAAHLCDSALSNPAVEPSTAVTAVLSLATYAAFYESSERALGLLEEIEDILEEAEPELVERAHLVNGIVALRTANWDRGEYHLRTALAGALKRNDVVQLAGLWNNLSCCALEQGDWLGFEVWAQKVAEIQATVSDPLDTFLPLALNRANALFYQGKARPAGDLYDYALTAARATGSLEFLPELLSCTGLVALQVGDTSAADGAWSEVLATRQDQLVGPQELFKYEWFSAFMRKRSGLEDAGDRLLKSAREQACLDTPSHLKLMWLGAILFGKSFSEAAGVTLDEIRRELFENGLGWFAGFATRWLRNVQARLPNV
jgi:tetratricopeptide (TPR) repeat protein